MEGSRREEPQRKKRGVNKQKEKKELRNTGKGYIQHKSMNLVSPRTMKKRCEGKGCEKTSKNCSKISEEIRREIFQDYWAQSSLALQREYLTRHIKVKEKKRTLTGNPYSRRKNTVEYHLPVDGNLQNVCKVFFLNTLGISGKCYAHSNEQTSRYRSTTERQKRWAYGKGLTERL